MLKLRVADRVLLVSSKSPKRLGLAFDEAVFVTPTTGLGRFPLNAILALSELPKVSLPSTKGPKSGRPWLVAWLSFRVSLILDLSAKAHYSLSNKSTSFVLSSKSSSTDCDSTRKWYPIALPVQLRIWFTTFSGS